MSSGIKVTLNMSDEDMVGLEIEVADGRSLFVTEVFVGHQEFTDALTGLRRFKDQLNGGIFDLQFGRFGPEIAQGAFHARFHFQKLGRLYITVTLESPFFDFGRKHVANSAVLHLMSEPALLDEFDRALEALRLEGSAELQGV